MQFYDDKLPSRVWDKIQPCPTTGCWLWSGSINQAGYGQVWWLGRKELSHILLYETAISSEKTALVLDHKCRQRLCCNPDHLDRVSQRVNCLRGSVSSVQKRRAEQQLFCVNGHPRNEENISVSYRQNRYKDGLVLHRRCRICLREWTRKRKCL